MSAQCAPPSVAYYPGSRTPIIRGSRTAARLPAPSGGQDQCPRIAPDVKARQFKIRGEVVDFFTIGQLARVLGRKPVTIRKWEADGVIPVARFRSPSHDERAKHRLYTREQVEGVVRIAWEEGLLSTSAASGRTSRRPIGETNFRKRVIALFAELAIRDRQQASQVAA